MLTKPVRRLPATVLLALGIWLLAGFGNAGGQGKGALVPDEDYPKVIAHELKALPEALKALKEAKEPLDQKRMAEKSRCTAVMIAAIAQDNLSGKDAAERATLRDAALEVAAL